MTTEITWGDIRGRLETWPGPRIADWQMGEWVKAFGRDKDPSDVGDALTEIYREQETDRWRQSTRPTIRDVRAILYPTRGPDDHTRSEVPDGPTMSFDEYRSLVANSGSAEERRAVELFESNVGGIGEFPDGNPRAAQLRKQRESVIRSHARLRQLELEVRADGISGEEALEAARNALRSMTLDEIAALDERIKAKGRAKGLRLV